MIFLDAPRMITVPKTVSVTPGTQEVRLDCLAVGYPLPKITWSHNGREIEPSSRRYQDLSGSLIIKHVEGSDHGTYRCEASNDKGRVWEEANVFIKLAPIITVQPENLNIQAGSIIKLACVASGTPKPSITWFKDDLEVCLNLQ